MCRCHLHLDLLSVEKKYDLGTLNRFYKVAWALGCHAHGLWHCFIMLELHSIIVLILVTACFAELIDSIFFQH